MRPAFAYTAQRGDLGSSARSTRENPSLDDIQSPLIFTPSRLLASRPRRWQTAALARSTPTDPIPRHFPRDVVRDLLGITRALYRVERVRPTRDPSRLARLEEVGRHYRQALDQGTKYGPDTMGGRAAISWAEKATAALGELVAESELMSEAVVESAKQLRRGR